MAVAAQSRPVCKPSSNGDAGTSPNRPRARRGRQPFRGPAQPAPSTAGASGASGVGLALCTRVIERLGGTIRAEDNVGAGATIVFDIAAREALPEADPLDAQAATVKRSAHVLVVDDNATNRMVAEALCEMFDCTSECAEDGVEAVEGRPHRPFRPDLDGHSHAADGRGRGRGRSAALPGAAGMVPIIALTANADAEDAEGYIASGMQGVVEKPIKPEKLLAAMNEALPDAAGRAAA